MFQLKFQDLLGTCLCDLGYAENMLEANGEFLAMETLRFTRIVAG
jgi:hypothetical protein